MLELTSPAAIFFKFCRHDNQTLLHFLMHNCNTFLLHMMYSFKLFFYLLIFEFISFSLDFNAVSSASPQFSFSIEILSFYCSPFSLQPTIFATLFAAASSNMFVPVIFSCRDDVFDIFVQMIILLILIVIDLTFFLSIYRKF